ncbi:MAG: HAMP domain-containing histidine kinase [Methanomassiliicoccales archaeon]|nr:HAMP domain-containing histidine kinase [Methanomassiliicoccales archaeon]
MNEPEHSNRHPFFLDLLHTLQRAEDEETALRAVLDTVAGTLRSERIGFIPEGRTRLPAMGDTGPWTAEARLLTDQLIKLLPSKKGFALALKSQGKRIGLLLVDGVKETKDLDDALPFLLTIPDALDMALSNVRHMRELNQSRNNLSQLSESLGVANKILRHDIANELLIISSSLDLFKAHGRERDLDRAEASLQRMQSIISQMRDLDCFLLSRSDMTATSLAQVIRTVLPPLEIAFSVEGDAIVLADPGLNAIIENLARNAKRHGKAQRMDFTIRMTEGKVHLSVHDDGKGISEDQLSRIFQEGVGFGETKGTGLGLYLVKRTMERYGGDISARNDPRGGARFELTFCPAEPS